MKFFEVLSIITTMGYSLSGKLAFHHMEESSNSNQQQTINHNNQYNQAIMTERYFWVYVHTIMYV